MLGKLIVMNKEPLIEIHKGNMIIMFRGKNQLETLHCYNIEICKNKFK